MDKSPIKAEVGFWGTALTQHEAERSTTAQQTLSRLRGSEGEEQNQLPLHQSQKTNKSRESTSEQPVTSAFSHGKDKHSKLGLLRGVHICLCIRPGQTVPRVPPMQDSKLLAKPTWAPLKDGGF